MADKKNLKHPLREEDVIARLKSASGGELAGLTTYTGLLGRSSKDGSWLLYPTLDMSTSIEIQESDIVHSEPLPQGQSPFGGLGGTLVFVRKGAQITTSRSLSRTSQAGAGDEFDLDLRVGRAESDRADLLIPTTFNGTACETPLCPSRNCPTGTCRTQCNQDTCQQTCTCRTQCNQDTCHTCPTKCNQETCIPDPRRTCGQICTRATCFVGCQF